ncbi:cysteine proteinase [Coniochaeta ligniaria NRRL 30616]|uniref:Cysteine proteinase n=1 Tax=Coniochaeta ligniaria NRRL 30616 TaxID=1408157 RepID=A0A1J7J2Z8_9PEZI|nr:cysteine proteinase [Coniochaeta ligniaria NRRL 30616]
MEAKARDHERKAVASSGSESLKHAITSAELYMQAAQKAKAKDDRARLSRKCNELLTLAERLKLVAANPDPPGPRSTRELTTAEKSIILRASRIHGKLFPPWDLPPGPDTFAKKDDEELYVDPSAYTFSPTQQELFAGWKRPSELMAVADGQLDTEKLSDDMMRASTDCDLVQDMVTDCSVVASLSAAMSHLCPQKDSLLRSLMYPFDHDMFRPKLSKSGKYVFRMHFNGCFRQVVIDDRLPSSSSASRTLFVVDRRNDRLIWPALMEKAYLKVRGGYDFPGSNSGTDLYVLTGWIPEQRFLHHDEFDIDQTWATMKKAYEKGNVVATLGTPALSAEEETALGLVSEHDYAVMDLKEESGDRFLLVKNPWRNSVVWKGVASSASVKTTEKIRGMFWISFEDVVQNFDSLYLNWNPALFTHRQDHHFTWELPAKTVASSLSHNPQYTVRSQTSDPIWILLCRHWQDAELDMLRDGSRHHNHTHTDRSNAARAATGTSPASVSHFLGFMGLQGFTTSPPGTCVLLPDRSPLYHTPLLDSPHTLLRLDHPSPNTPYTIVLAQSDLPLPKYSFTLAFFSLSPLTVTPSPSPHPHTQSLSGSWTRRTAGGNTASPAYRTNPSWSITVPSPTSLSLLLTTDDHDLPIHICVVYRPTSSSPPSAISQPSRRDLLMSSGEYRRGAAHVQSPTSAPVQPGSYIATASTFTPGQLANFVLRVGSDAPLAITPLATPEAGRLRREIPPLVLTDNHGENNTTIIHRALVQVSRLTRLSLLARCATTPTTNQPASSGSPCAIRVSLELGRSAGPHRTVLAVAPCAEGEFTDAVMGLRTEEVDVAPETARERGGLWVVVESVGGGGGGGGGETGGGGHAVVVEVLSDNGVSVGGWEAGGGY